jgi:mannan endo-1,4-beta-mannosidase
VDYCADFARDTCAQALYYEYVERIVTRRNTITGRPYREEPAIMAWQLCNEPRPFARDSVTKEMFAGWIARAAALIKHLDPNHLASTGSEGMVGCEADMALCERIHADENIDYLTLHIWPINWGWASRTDPDSGIDNACAKSSQYIALHTEMATRLGKPLVIEEFGYARQGNRAGIGIPTESKDRFYRHIFGEVKRSIAEGGPIAGSNFWGWSGSGRPRQEVWQAGDDYLCDPPHEPQGWYSVFDSDTTTIEIIKEYTKAITR